MLTMSSDNTLVSPEEGRQAALDFVNEIKECGLVLKYIVPKALTVHINTLYYFKTGALVPKPDELARLRELTKLFRSYRKAGVFPMPVADLYWSGLLAVTQQYDNKG